MKTVICSLIFLLSFTTNAQQTAINSKGSFYIYWGWNRAAYTHSDIHFAGNDYDFTLKDVIANDRQSPFESRIYLNPKNLTIPQFNLRLGYYFRDKYEISIGTDHMKYVMKNDQTVNIDGYIHNSGTVYDGEYTGDKIVLAHNFLLFEHTDGLNYINTEIRRSDILFERNKIAISSQAGFGIGALMPKTNTTLLNNARYDEFHLAGFGTGIVGALNFTFFKYFFVQAEAKFGYINMPDIRTTMSTSDKADQQFCFMQFNGSFGVRYNILKSQRERNVNPED